MKKAFVLAILIAFGGSTTALAQAGREQHDGFAMRLALGGGYSSSSESVSGTSLTVSGGSVLMSFAFGYAVIDNLIVNVDMFGAGVISPTFSAGGQSSSPEDVSVTHAGFGAGLTYYFMPINIYAAASVGMARSQIEASGMKFETGTGWGLNAMLGKEWWVSDNWGLGLAGQFIYMNVPDGDYSFGTMGGGVLFTATYN